MKKTLLLATAIGLMLPASAYAEDIVLKFWDNQQTESGLSQYQQEAVKSFEAANPGIKVEVTTIPYPEYQQRLLTAVQGGNAPDVSTVDQIWVAAFAEAGAIDAARRRGEGRRRHRRHLLPRRLGLGQLRRQALRHPVQRRCLAVLLLQRRPAQGGGRRPGVGRDLRRAEGGGREAHRCGQRQVRHRPLRPQGRGHRRGDGLVHLLERRQSAQR